jgi:hypothetical protein
MKPKAVTDVKTRGEAISIAIDWQRWCGDHAVSYGELADYQGYFEKLANKFNLRDEFKENGIL